MKISGTEANHLSFADQIILFTSRRCKTLKLLLTTLKEYENISGQLINGDKSHFMLHSNAFNSTTDRIKRLTGFTQKQGPITYLGCLYLLAGLGISIFLTLLIKLWAELQGGKPNNLPMGARQILQNMCYKLFLSIYFLQYLYLLLFLSLSKGLWLTFSAGGIAIGRNIIWHLRRA